MIDLANLVVRRFPCPFLAPPPLASLSCSPGGERPGNFLQRGEFPLENAVTLGRGARSRSRTRFSLVCATFGSPLRPRGSINHRETDREAAKQESRCNWPKHWVLGNSRRLGETATRPDDYSKPCPLSLASASLGLARLGSFVQTLRNPCRRGASEGQLRRRRSSGQKSGLIELGSRQEATREPRRGQMARDAYVFVMLATRTPRAKAMNYCGDGERS